MGSDARARLSQWAAENDVALVFFDPARVFDQAIVGLVVGFGQAPAVLYDEARVLTAMMADGPMDEDEAREWYAFNTIGSYVGESTPRFLVGVPC